MISSYARQGLGEEALGLFVLTWRKNLRPTEYMVSCLLSCFSSVLQVELGNQIHSLVLKLGFESDAIVANSLVGMYAKFGSIYDALNIFNEIRRDLISWNTILMGLTYNGEVSAAMDIFSELIGKGMPPDRITLYAALEACNYGSLVDEGIQILSSMEKEFGVKPEKQHYAFAVELFGRAGRLKEAIDIIMETMPHKTALVWKSILSTCAISENL
ncbi:pentatricopeptide repeat-containing protein At1g43980, mitochondrial-like [Neltuma alba]|uniref:pentatricopeptide repeat-containing protein At1g43980, mitochondrial-like n=1 Tax=Neltuma alba TaxID=207710 RepID=UPI0010A58850|nr:pentatricopeptide repeat-containing protein At1g43980, mitochondrial-like [Prosopis alba]